MTDTEILDFLEKSIEQRKKDQRWERDYMCRIGTVSFSLGVSQPSRFRDLVENAAIVQITDRLKK